MKILPLLLILVLAFAHQTFHRYVHRLSQLAKQQLAFAGFLLKAGMLDEKQGELQTPSSIPVLVRGLGPTNRRGLPGAFGGRFRAW